MSRRAVVNVATDSWITGQSRLRRKMADYGDYGERFVWWADTLPKGCPPHRTRGNLAATQSRCVEYAFKAYALQEAANDGYDTLLWADSCVVPIRPMEPLWEKIERDGVWFCDNGYKNYDWCADSAYPDLFPEYFTATATSIPGVIPGIEGAREINRTIKHVVATAFGLSLKHERGRAFLAEYYRLASQTKAFRGPWQNSNAVKVEGRNTDRYAAACGPPDVLGHRHDQTAASVIVWRLGVELTQAPEYFSYLGGETHKTILVADGGMVL